MQNTQQTVEELLKNHIQQAFDNYGVVIALLVVGMIIGWTFKSITIDRKYQKQINIRLKEKDQRIAELNFIVHDRLNNIEVDEIHKSVFNRVKKFFKKFATKKE